MFLVLPPPPPKRPRHSFESDIDYQAYEQNYRAAMKSYDDHRRSNEALMILVSSIVLIGTCLGLGSMIFALFGWRGFAWAASIIGLCWVAFIQIRRRIP